MILLGLTALKALFLSAFLVYPDLVWDYPFPGGDGLEWLVSGLWIGGSDVACVGRQPLWPAAVALVDHLGLLRLLPLLSQLCAAALVMTVYWLVRHRYTAAVAFACASLVLAAQSVTWMSLEWMADLPAALLATIALHLWLRAADGAAGWGRHLAGAAAGLTQGAVALLLLPVALWTERRRAILAALALLAPLVGWRAVLQAVDCSPLVPQAQVHSLGLRLSAFDDYAAFAVAFFGWPALALAAIGVLGSALSATRRRRLAPACLYLGAFVALFVVAYGFRSMRLMVYALPGVILLLAEGLERVEGRRLAFTGVAVASLVGAVWPSHGVGDVRAMVWPLPALEMHATIDGLAAEPPPMRTAFSRPALSAVAARSAVALVVGTRRAAEGSRRPDTAGASEVLLQPVEASAEDRHAAKLRWMATLRRPVRVAPRDLYPDAAGIWATPPEGVVGEMGAVGVAIQEALHGADGYLAVVRGGIDDDALRSLPFVVRSTNLFFLTPGTAARLPRTAAPRREFGPFLATASWVRGRPVLLLERR